MAQARRSGIAAAACVCLSPEPIRRFDPQDEMARLLVALKRNRHGQRDWLLGLLIYRHGLRVSEACDLRWDDIDLPKAHDYRSRAELRKRGPLIDLEAIREQQAVENRLPVTVNGSEAEAFSPLRRRPPGTGASSA